ncbi:MAG TPA: hypothetical protein VIK72_00525 [Clostridiaceae bacterium]
MSKHKKHNREKEVIQPDVVKETEKQEVKPEQNNIASLLNNIDMSQLSDFMSNLGMGTEGENVADGIGAGAGTGLVNDKRLEVMSAIKPMLDTEKGQILDTIIQLYGISKILKKK